ncbi:NADH:ubiquinone oxidoreductase, chain F [Candidatus Nitrospira nitrosa]|uniref:NADH:ubiquinone oxidoreductase, chain F n=1 Tax=Candidatus Nitrospira nitrosa TaxID=1742972 RepID=A0A0S4LRD9_9BACT|nr:NADH-quinone oxidoreductase subunit NuoF [Candidatus Nitrospira nitrosa]CUS39184.1 NADH:ubiquinone oxidoreductase, chain F [Candidatus Nitrospira nitrosa]
MNSERPLTRHLHSDGSPRFLREYVATGGYRSLQKLAAGVAPKDVQRLVSEAGLRGRGGGGFPTGAKWSFVPMGPDAQKPKYIVANGDEMEPGTFKDRILMEGDPHGLVEGMIMAGYALDAEVGYIFLRGEYHLSAQRLNQAIAEAYAAGYLGKSLPGTTFRFDLHLHSSAGRYICGEETALINALEGKRAVPRAKPPFPQTVGLWGQPTIVQNVETLYNIPHIINHGADWYHRLSRTQDGGTKMYGISGRVRNPGWWELPFGTSARELLEQHAGGMAEGVRFRALLPGGISTAFMIEEHLDLPLDFSSFPPDVGRLGTGTMIILDDQTCPVGFVLNLEKFFARESCGWCTPCREGLPWVAKLLTALEEGRATSDDLSLLEMHTKWLAPGHTFCGLAPGAMAPLQSALKYFRDDFERHISIGGCPWSKKSAQQKTFV